MGAPLDVLTILTSSISLDCFLGAFSGFFLPPVNNKLTNIQYAVVYLMCSSDTRMRAEGPGLSQRFANNQMIIHFLRITRNKHEYCGF